MTLKKRDGLIFVINDPEVLKSTANDTSYAVFGELKLEDTNNPLKNNIKDFKEQAKKTDATTDEKKEEDKKVEDDSEPLSEEGLSQEHIGMVIEHTQCTRNQAIRALRETNDDMVQAVMKLTSWANLKFVNI